MRRWFEKLWCHKVGHWWKQVWVGRHGILYRCLLCGTTDWDVYQRRFGAPVRDRIGKDAAARLLRLGDGRQVS